MKIKVLEPKIKEIKSEKKDIKEEISDLEQEVFNDINSQMPRGNFNTSLPINLMGENLEDSLPPAVQQSNRPENNSFSAQSSYGSNSESQRDLEAKYQVSSLADQRMQTAINLARERENIRTRSNFENPDLRQFGSSQSGEDYESRMSTTDVSVKRRNHWEGG